MCGITGIIRFDGTPVQKAEIDAFTDSLAHRGPDGRGVWHDPNYSIALGHRRLAILDLSPAGTQPMHYQDRYSIVFNGEIYNYQELRKELIALGHVFYTGTDTEVALAAYGQWGESFQHKLNGMWAIAIWDRKRQTLFLSRDRFGVKPLYYLRTKNVVAFASELKSFFHLTSHRVAFDESVIAETLSNINGLEGVEVTMIRDVYKVLPGHSVHITKENRIHVTRWWNTVDVLNQHIPEHHEDRVEVFRNILDDACNIRLRSDVPVASSLSGGLDSSSIVSTIAGFSSDRPLPYSVFIAHFSNANQDELEYANAVAKFHRIDPIVEHIDMQVTPERIMQTVWHTEDIYWVPLLGPFLLYESMRKKGTVVSLDGHGADEMLAGYHFFLLREWIASMASGKLHQAQYAYSMLQGMMGGSVTNIPQQTLGMAWQAFHTTALAGTFRAAMNSLRPVGFLQQPIRRHQLWSEPISAPNASFSSLNNDLYGKFHHSVLPTILRNFDRLSMAHGVEVRSPFLDWRLVSYCFSLPDTEKIGQRLTKTILRDAMQGRMPEDVRLRKNKMGFTSPVGTWFTGSLKNFLLDIISDQEFVSSPIWDGKRIAAFAHTALKNNNVQQLESIWPYLNAYLVMKQLPHNHAAL